MPALTTEPKHLPPGHVILPAAAIGLLSIVLAVGLQVLGIVARINATAAGALSGGKEFPKSLPAWAIWLAVAFFAFGISFAILAAPGMLRRLVLWITAIVLVLGWAPVLALASREPQIAAVLVAAVWSGICALVYSSRHEMACDVLTNPPADETR